ncbi:MAG: AraC family transcriptional regulator [Ruminococcaceae bacterium]|nr:AraC family transcriptional regulator [Oscillospiraceae bacterium]
MKYIPFKLPSVLVVEKLVTVHYFEFSKNFYYPPEAHDFWELHYVDKGSAISISNGERTVLTQGDLLLHPPMTTHQIITDGESLPNVCVVSFVLKPADPPFLAMGKMHLDAEARSVMKRFLTEAGHLFDLSKSDPAAHRMRTRVAPPLGTAQLCRLYLEELLLLLGRSNAQPDIARTPILLSDSCNDPLVRDMVLYMQENLTKNLTIADFCKRFSYGKTHLCTKFSEVTGKTINAYFIELKIIAAKQIIREQSSSRELFARVADLLGFSSPSYFYYTFKRLTGMTPTQYFKSVHQYDFEKDSGAST